jgi:hypothetical protein
LREKKQVLHFSLFWGVFFIDLRHYDGNIWIARILFLRCNFSRADLVALLHNLCLFWR